MVGGSFLEHLISKLNPEEIVGGIQKQSKIANFNHMQSPGKARALNIKNCGTDALARHQVQSANGLIGPTKTILYPENNGEPLKCFRWEVTPSGLPFREITLPAT